MGVEQRVACAGGQVPAWTEVRDLFARHGFPVQLRMIDGELSFPDELPPAGWRELRLGTPAGMITVRREAEGVAVVAWGNAEPALVQAWNAVAWVFAEAGGGRVRKAEGSVSAADYRRTADLPPPLRTPG
jgi:hypothetical protein